VRPLMLTIVDALARVDVGGERVGWCRGETGVAIGLLGAARALERPELAERAVDLARAPFERDAARWPLEAGLCHGAAGVAHLTNRVYQATGDGRLGEHARTWLRKTMAMQQPGTGVGGYAMRSRTSATEWEADPSLLVGAAGVGLALLAGATSRPPSWDELLGMVPTGD